MSFSKKIKLMKTKTLLILFTHGFSLNLNSGNNNQRNDNDEKNPLIILMTTIYFNNHQKLQFKILKKVCKLLM